MSLDPPPTLAQALAIKAEREARAATHRGIALGPNALVQPERPGAAPRRARRTTAGQPTEHAIQVAVFAWVRDPAALLERPELAYVFAVPNGGKRSPAVAAKLKAEGATRGVPDVWCPVRRMSYPGLVVEIKRPGGSLSPEQADWLAALHRQGWKTAVHEAADAVIDEIRRYLALPL